MRLVGGDGTLLVDRVPWSALHASWYVRERRSAGYLLFCANHGEELSFGPVGYVLIKEIVAMR